MLLAAPALREAPGEWIEMSSCRRRQWENGVDYIHWRCHLQGKAKWSMPGTAGTGEASHLGIAAEGYIGQGSVELESSLS